MIDVDGNHHINKEEFLAVCIKCVFISQRVYLLCYTDSIPFATVKLLFIDLYFSSANVLLLLKFYIELFYNDQIFI